jgi:K+-transporting ATPase A subunit
MKAKIKKFLESNLGATIIFIFIVVCALLIAIPLGNHIYRKHNERMKIYDDLIKNLENINKNLDSTILYLDSTEMKLDKINK